MKLRWGIMVAGLGAALLAYVWITYKLIPASGPPSRPDPNFLPGELTLLSIALLVAGAILIVVARALNHAQANDVRNRHQR